MIYIFLILKKIESIEIFTSASIYYHFVFLCVKRIKYSQLGASRNILEIPSNEINNHIKTDNTFSILLLHPSAGHLWRVRACCKWKCDYSKNKFDTIRNEGRIYVSVLGCWQEMGSKCIPLAALQTSLTVIQDMSGIFNCFSFAILK